MFATLSTVLSGFVVQGSLFDLGRPDIASLDGTVERVALSDSAWIDIRRDWISGSAQLVDSLVRTVPFQAESRPMYDRIVDVPRLTAFYAEDDDLPDPLLDAMRTQLDAHYEGELGERFVTAGLCLYRDGRDSVTWHGDTIGRGAVSDTMVAIVSLGAKRTLKLRPRGGGTGRRYDLGHGDLLVMGGSCQRTWEHAVPKTARAVGPRLSIQFRPTGCR